MHQWRTAVVCGLVLLGPGGASAQTRAEGDRVFVHINVGAHVRAQDQASQFVFPLFRETATVDVSRTISGSRFVDVTVGTTSFRRFGAAVRLMRRSAASDATLTASLPDPIFYDSPHAFSGVLSALGHDETSVAVLVAYQAPVSDRIAVTLLAGPVVTRVEHEVVTEVSLDPATGQVSAQLAHLSRDLIGLQAGVDVRYLLTRWLGLGASLGYQSTSGHLGPAVKVDLSGLQYGAGLRLRF